MVENINFRINQFLEFYDLLMKNAPENYKPWFFPCEKNNKNPSPQAILNLDRNSKGSWHHESARLTKEKAIELIKQGYNIGISARENDPLIIIDIDNPKFSDKFPEDTLTTYSRKRAGGHLFYWDKNGTAKINLPTDDGEIRSNNQYVLSPGSYVPFNLESKKEVESFEQLPLWAKQDRLRGYYTIRNKTNRLKKISFDEVPEFFKKAKEREIEEETKILQSEEQKQYKKEGKYSELFNLKVSDIIGKLPSKKRYSHPLHESDTNANFSLSEDGSIGHCWRHLVSLNPVQFLCVKNGYAKCQDAGTPHKGRGISKIRGDKKALEVAYQEALDMGLISEWKGNKNIKKITKNYYNKVELAENIWEEIPFFYDSNKIWWLWDKTNYKWKQVDETDILLLVREITEENTINSKERGELIEAFKQEGRNRKPKEIKKTWVQFKNKIIDVENGEEIEASPEYFVTNPINFEIGESEETPVMDRIFTEWVGEEFVNTLYEIVAYCLLPDYPIHRLFCLAGSGSNGKSKYFELIRKFVGIENITSTDLEDLLNSRFEKSKLYKRLVVFMGETNFNTLNRTSLLKRLTGGDTISFEIKNKNAFDDVNYAKILIATNGIPYSEDKTEGFYRRWLIIEFPNKFSEKKDILKEIPDEEYNNLARKCSTILKNLLEKRKFSNEGTIQQRKEKYEELSNPVDMFIEENCKREGEIPFFKFYEELCNFSTSRGYRPLGKIEVSKILKREGFEIKTKTFTKDDGKQTSWKIILPLSLDYELTKEKRYIIRKDIQNYAVNSESLKDKYVGDILVENDENKEVLSILEKGKFIEKI